MRHYNSGNTKYLLILSKLQAQYNFSFSFVKFLAELMRKKSLNKMYLNFVLFLCLVSFVSGENVNDLELMMANVVSFLVCFHFEEFSLY